MRTTTSAGFARSGLGARLAIAALLAAGILALPGAASAANPSILNTGTGCSGQTQWLISCATLGESGSGTGHVLRISTLLSHDLDKTIASLVTDDDWNSTVNPANVRSVSPQRPNIVGGYPRSRVNLSYTIPTSNTGMSCTPPFSGTRRTTNRNARFLARDSAGQNSATSSSQIKFVAHGNCLGPEDFAYIYRWDGMGSGGSCSSPSGNNFSNSITPGTTLTYCYTGDDPDTTGSSDFDGVFWRLRNIRTGATTAGQLSCPGNGDNAVKPLQVTFPNRGAWVVEAELRDRGGGNCSDNQNPGFWFPIGTADVNSAAAPTLNLSATRPQTNGNTTISATGLVDPDSAQGGGAQIIEWDLDGNTGNGVDGFETTTVANVGQVLASPQTRVINTAGQTPGLKTVRARVTDNGAMDAADSIRRRSSVVTATYLVNSPPTANPQSVVAETGTAKPITLTGSDPNNDSLSFTITSPPSNGALTGTGANRTYTSNGSFAGNDSFSFQVSDGFGGTHTAVVAIEVAPQTQITSSPDDPSPIADASFQFTSPVPGASFECRIDSTEEAAFAPCTSPRNFVGLSEGPHTFEVRALSGPHTDPTPASYTWTVSANAPNTFIDSTPPNPSNQTSAEFAFSSDDPTASFECRLDPAPGGGPGDGWQACSSPHQLTDLDEGPHVLQVRARDVFDRVDLTPASYAWTVDVTPPVAKLDSAPADPSNQTTAAFAFSSTDLSATFECRLDSDQESGWQSCTSPASYPGLGEGPHSFDLRASDPAGNVSEVVSHTWEIDVTAPETTLISGPPDPSNQATATFTFESPDDATAGFECRIDAGDWEPCGSPQLFADLPDGERSFEVRAVDLAGNADPTPESFAWTIDTTAPATQIDSGPLGHVASAEATFEFSSDDEGASYECRLDAGDWEACESPHELSGLAEGPHTFRVRATDALANTDQTPAQRSWVVDTTAPVVQIDSGPADPTNSTAASFEFDSNEPGSSFECRLDPDGGPEDDWETCSSSHTHPGPLTEGPHTFEVRATDLAGNTGAAVAHEWEIDLTAPAVIAVTRVPAQSPTSSQSMAIHFESDPAGASFECRLGGGAWQACTSPRTYTGLGDGDHEASVRATDQAGNTGDPATTAWTVEHSGPPNTFIDSGPADPTSATEASFTFSATEPASFQCSLDDAAFTPCVSPAAYADLALGEHTFQVRAIDTDSNVDPTPAAYTWLVVEAPAGPGDPRALPPQIRRGKRKVLRRGRGVAATVACPAGPCRITRRKAVVRIAGRRYKAKVKVAAALATGRTAKVRIVLPKRARAALATAGRGRAVLRLAARSAGGTTQKTLRLRLRK